MRQQTLADGSFEKFRKKNRKELFLDDMEQIIPWQDLCGVIEPYYPKPEGAGRGPVGIERKLPFSDWTLEGDYRPNPVIEGKDLNDVKAVEAGRSHPELSVRICIYVYYEP